MSEIIDTQSAQYQNYFNGLKNLSNFYKPKLVLFAKLPRDKQRLWLQRDPLLRKLLKTALKVSEWAEQFKNEVQQ